MVPLLNIRPYQTGAGKAVRFSHGENVRQLENSASRRGLHFRKEAKI